MVKSTPIPLWTWPPPHPLSTVLRWTDPRRWTRWTRWDQASQSWPRVLFSPGHVERDGWSFLKVDSCQSWPSSWWRWFYGSDCQSLSWFSGVRVFWSHCDLMIFTMIMIKIMIMICLIGSWSWLNHIHHSHHDYHYGQAYHDDQHQNLIIKVEQRPRVSCGCSQWSWKDV